MKGPAFISKTNLRSRTVLMDIKKRMIKESKRTALFVFWSVCLLGFPLTVSAGEEADYKDKGSTFYSDLFDQNIYNEGVNQLDLGRWERKIFREALPAKNVNIFDEVPDSGFFINRHGREPLSLAALEKGNQETSGPDLSQPLEVIAAEQRGIHPCLWVKDARGDEYLLEFDPLGNLELMTGAAVVANRFYHALGYFVPQLTLASIERNRFRVASGATTWEDTGFKKPLTQERLEEYLLILPQDDKGFFRALARKTPPGAYRGSFSFESRKKEDPENLVNHRDRREIRALGIFASWLNHYDLRASGTSEMAIKENGTPEVQYYLDDFSGALGATRQGPKAPMLGYEHAIDYGETFKAILTLGFWKKPWQKKWDLADREPPASRAVGYFTNGLFDPSDYKTQFSYEAFRVVTRADGFWTAKLLKSFSDEDIRAVVKAGKYSDPADAETLTRTLIERRDLVARYWLLRANPLDGFSFSGGKLSFRDLAADYGFAPASGTVYQAEGIAPDAETKNFRLENTETFLELDPKMISEQGETKVLLRVTRPSLSGPSPLVTILLNAAGIQGIQREN